MTPLRIGFVGAGAIVNDYLAPALSQLEHAHLWSVSSRSIESAERIATKFRAQNSMPTYATLDAQLADPNLDAVIIASPDAFHAEHAIKAMRAGKQVFVEKPMAITIDDAVRMRDCAVQTNRKLQVGFHSRFHAAHQFLFQTLRSNMHGAIHRIRMDWSFHMTPETTPWRATGIETNMWILSALGTHAIDLATWLVCDEIKTISIHTTNVQFGLRDEQAMISMRTTNGTLIELFVSALTRRTRILEVNTEKTDFRLEDTLGSRPGGTITMNGIAVPFEPIDPYRAELEAFVRATQQDLQTSPNADDGLKNIQSITQGG